MKEIDIRPYQSGDWARMMEIHDRARLNELRLAGLTEAFVPLAEAAKREGLFDYTVIVALCGGDVLGFAAYSEDELAWLYVDPAYAREGIGRQLVQYVLDHTATRPLCVEVLSGNAPAIALYTSMGFETVETCSGVMPGNEGFAVTAHCMQHA